MEHESTFSEILLKYKAQSGSVNLQNYQGVMQAGKKQNMNIHTHAQGKIRLKPKSDRLITKVHTDL